MNNHILYGPAPQIIFGPAGCVVIDNLTNWDELLSVVGGKVLLPALLFLQLALILLPDRHVYVQTATPINRYDKIDYKTVHEIDHKIVHEIDHKIVYENDHTIDIQTRNRLLGERPQHDSFVSNGVPYGRGTLVHFIFNCMWLHGFD